MEPDPLRAELATWLRIVRYAVLGVVVLTVLFFAYFILKPVPPRTAADLRQEQETRCSMTEYLRATGGIPDSLSKGVCP